MNEGVVVFEELPTIVIIAEDDSTHRNLLKIFSRNKLPHAQIELACNGEEAWEALQRASASPARIFVTTDCRMPKIDGKTDGLTLIAKITAAKTALMEAGVIVKTAMISGGEENEACARMLGVDLFFKKPVFGMERMWDKILEQ